MKIFLIILTVFIGAGTYSYSQVPVPSATATGIPLNETWKIKVYQFAEKNVVHPSWGIAHSERDYQTTFMLAQKQGVAIDLDVLFAAAFLHDLGGIGQFQKQGVDHAVRSVELAGPLLQSFGFPMSKLSAVNEMILGHTYYGNPPQGQANLLFRDADILDFLGTIGIARILAITQEPGQSGKLSSTVGVLNKFIADLPPKLSSAIAKTIGGTRVNEMKDFMRSLGEYSYSGKAL